MVCPITQGDHKKEDRNHRAKMVAQGDHKKLTTKNNNINYTVSQKKGATLTMAITLSIFDGFAKFFHCCKEQLISNKTNITLPTTPQVCCCITLENVKIRNLQLSCM